MRLVAPITKYAVCVDRSDGVRYHLEKAVWLATHGRPGPVWIDVPLNVQAAQVDAGRAGAGFDAGELRRRRADAAAGPAVAEIREEEVAGRRAA